MFSLSELYLMLCFPYQITMLQNFQRKRYCICWTGRARWKVKDIFKQLSRTQRLSQSDTLNFGANRYQWATSGTWLLLRLSGAFADREKSDIHRKKQKNMLHNAQVAVWFKLCRLVGHQHTNHAVPYGSAFFFKHTILHMLPIYNLDPKTYGTRWCPIVR